MPAIASPYKNERDQTGIFQFVDHFEPFRHGCLSAHDASVMSIVVQMDVVIVVIIQPFSIKVEGRDRHNEDDKGHDVIHEIHKLQRSFLQSVPKERHAITTRR